MNDGSREITYSTASDFLSAMRRSNPLWLGDGEWENNTIFRGQSRESWDLSPSAWRREVQSHPLYQQIGQIDASNDVQAAFDSLDSSVLRNGGIERVRTLMRQKRFEVGVVHAFAWMADRLGLRIPGGGFQWHAPRRIKIAMTSEEDDADPLRYARAFAQHHGIPTRILDWTYSPEIAAFFATEGFRQDQGEGIAVWSMSLRGIINPSSKLRVLTIDRNEISYLHAQEGLFTYLAGADRYFQEKGAWPTFESEASGSRIQKHVLLLSQVPELRRLLWAEGISRAHLMPTLDNVTRALEGVWKESWRQLSGFENEGGTEN